MSSKLFVDVNEIAEDWGVSRSKAYTMIKEMNRQMQAINPALITLSGKVNRKFYEEICYGVKK